MSIDPRTRKLVCFVGTKQDGSFRPRATGFFVSWNEGDRPFTYLVTAEHVVERALSIGAELYIRVNLDDGSSKEMAVSAASFLYHPDAAREATDVAVFLIKEIVWSWNDVHSVPLNGPRSMACSKEVFDNGYAGLGDQVYIVGLFRFHGGQRRNLPVVRVGNLAALAEELISGGGGRELQGHLIEARSIGGLSGSPVLISPPSWRWSWGSKRPIDAPEEFYLLGLVHGHFDAPSIIGDEVVDDDGVIGSVNTGIGIVVPTEKIVETIAQPAAQAERDIVRNSLGMA